MSLFKTNRAFSIILPLYKPSGSWANLFLENIKELNALIPTETTIKYIVVYDGLPSADITASFEKIAASFNSISFLSYPENMGKGYALRHGVKIADTPYTLITDFDFPYKKENIVELMNLLIEGNDIVVGKRSKTYFDHLPFKRKIISRLCVRLQKMFLDLPLYDTQSGIKGFNNSGKNIFLQTTINRFLIDTEFILRSSRKNISIKQIDIELESYVEFSNFGIKVIRTEMNNFLKLLRLNSTLKKSSVL